MQIGFNHGRLLLLSIIVSACQPNDTTLKPELVILGNHDEIILIQDSLVRPILYQNIPKLYALPLKQIKEKFIAIVLPAVIIAKHDLTQARKQIAELTRKEVWSAEDSTFYGKQLQRFKAKNKDDLLNRMITHPNSIVLAQAAVESGWGSSRFFREGNYLFWIWSYRADEPRIVANGDGVYLRKYEDISQSIEDYFVTLGRARPYRQFREARVQSQEVAELLPYLKYYSQRGKAYTDQLAIMVMSSKIVGGFVD